MKKALCFILILLSLGLLNGCAAGKEEAENKKEVDFTVVEKESMPEELLKVIEEKKAEEFSFSYAMEGYMYIVQGYGKQSTSGYSIRVDEMYDDGESIVVHTTLIGPYAGEAVNKKESYPYIVLKIENTDKNIIFE